MITYTTITLQKPAMRFTAGHFTIFSATEREKLHGHNFTVCAAFETKVAPDLGMAFDYGIYNRKLTDLCKSLDQVFLLPNQSPYLEIEMGDPYVFAHFNGEAIPFLPKDIFLVPLKNITLEELSRYFIEQLTDKLAEIEERGIYGITITIASAPGQTASATWQRRKPEEDEPENIAPHRTFFTPSEPSSGS